MNDPHVEKLIYNIGSAGIVEYDSPEASSFTNDLGDFVLSSGKLTVTLSHHFPDPQDARELIESYLRSWEMESDLTQNLGTIRFAYSDVVVIDRNPPPPPPPGSPITVSINATLSAITASGSARISIRRTEYPAPPSAFRNTQEASLAYQRWKQYSENKEPLQSMAYAVLTLAYSSAGGRENAPNTLSISSGFLRTIARLSSQPGLDSQARKLDAQSPRPKLTGTDRSWLETATKKLILRMGEIASGKDLYEITMDDLPLC